MLDAETKNEVRFKRQKALDRYNKCRTLYFRVEDDFNAEYRP